MLMIALKQIPGTVQIAPGQQFHELNPELADQWIKTGFARVPDAPNSRGWNGLHWDGATVVILASGESLTEEQCERVRNWRAADGGKVVAINTTFRRAPWADLLYACDDRWWEAVDPATGLSHFEEAARIFPKSKLWTQDQRIAEKLQLTFVRSARAPGLSRQVGIINQGSNGGYQAINLAYWSGAKRMILLGFDCKGSHWHGDHPAPLANKQPFKIWIDNFRALAHDLKEVGVDVVNCSPGTAIPHFTKGELGAVL